MVAIGTWVGGLVWLLLGIRGVQTPVRAAAVRVFSRVATVALVVVLATGSLRAIVQVGSIGGLFDTSYGVTLLVKLGLVAVLVALGAVNHYRLVPAFSAADTTYRPFSLNSRGEIVVAIAVLATTAVLVGLAPPL
jgi:putative copper export protein